MAPPLIHTSRDDPHPPTASAALMGLLILLVSFGSVSQNMYLPSLSSLRADLNAQVWEANLTLSVFLLGFAAAQLIIGPLSDRFGRRRVLIASIILFLVASILCAAIRISIVARLLQAAGACAGSVISRAVVRDLYEPGEAARQLPMITIEPSRNACVLFPPEFQAFSAGVVEKSGEHF